MQWMRKAISISAITLAVAMTAPAFAADYTADVVVIGAGASGSAAALASQQSGAKTILLEKTPSRWAPGRSRAVCLPLTLPSRRLPERLLIRSAYVF